MASNAVRKNKDEQALSMGEAVLRRRELKELTDSQVVQAFLDGEQRAFGELVRRYDNRLVNFVYRTVALIQKRYNEIGAEEEAGAGQEAEAAA